MNDSWWRRGVGPPWFPVEPREIVVPGRQHEYPHPDRRPVTSDEFDDFIRRVTKEVEGGSWPPPPPDLREVPTSDGVEPCAWYRSFRWSNGWGIHLRFECWVKLATYLYRSGIPIEVAVDEAFYLFYRHEFFHFAVDRSVLHFERVVRAGIGTPIDLWHSYHSRNRPSLLEEALANAYAYEHAGARHEDVFDPDRVKDVVAEVMVRQPPGYRDFESVLGASGRLARSQLMLDIVSVHSGFSDEIPNLGLVGGLPSFKSVSSPIPRVRFEDRRLELYIH